MASTLVLAQAAQPQVSQELNGQGFVIVVSVLVLLAILELVRRHKIGERFSLLWLAIAAGLVLSATAAFPLLFSIAPLLGIVYPATALFLLAFLGLTGLCVYFTVILSQLSSQNRVLAQRVSLLEEEQASLRRDGADGAPAGRRG